MLNRLWLLLLQLYKSTKIWISSFWLCDLVDFCAQVRITHKSYLLSTLVHQDEYKKKLLSTFQSVYIYVHNKMRQCDALILDMSMFEYTYNLYFINKLTPLHPYHTARINTDLRAQTFFNHIDLHALNNKKRLDNICLFRKRNSF